jgi:hypothetical protein
MKGVVIYQIALDIEVAKKGLEEMKVLFETRDEDVNIDIFFLTEVTAEDIKHLAVKVTCGNLRKAQVQDLLVFKYLSLLELANNTFSPDENKDMYIDVADDGNPILHVGNEMFEYSQIFANH